VRPGADFSSFRYHDVGRPGHILRLAGHRPSGTWADAAWLIAKRDAHVEEGKLVGGHAAGAADPQNRRAGDTGARSLPRPAAAECPREGKAHAGAAPGTVRQHPQGTEGSPTKPRL